MPAHGRQAVDRHREPAGHLALERQGRSPVDIVALCGSAEFIINYGGFGVFLTGAAASRRTGRVAE
jgi:hypothetical protein